MLIKKLKFGVLLLMLSGVGMAQDWQRPFFFIIMADPQVGWDQNGYNSEELFTVAVEEANKLEPDFVLIAGDLVQTAGSNQQYDITKAIVDDLEMPYYVIPGNHDVGMPPTMNNLDWYSEKWSVPLWYTFTYYNSAFPMIETNTLRARDMSEADSEIRDLAVEHITWLDNELDSLTRAGFAHIYPVGHHPLAKNSIDDPDANANTPITVRQDLLDLYHKHNITTVFAGHAHHNARLTDGDLELVTYASTGVILGNSDESGFAIVKINGSEMEQQYYGYADLPSEVESDNPGFEITFPNSGEALTAGSIESITWNSESMVRDVVLEYTLDGNAWQSITGSTPNSGSFNWTIPDESSTTVKVRISSANDAGINDESDGNNTIGTEVSINSNRVRSLFTFGAVGTPIFFTDYYKNYIQASVFDLSGNQVQTIELQPGANTWNGRDVNNIPVAKGVYLVRFTGTSKKSGPQNRVKRIAIP